MCLTSGPHLINVGSITLVGRHERVYSNHNFVSTLIENTNNASRMSERLARSARQEVTLPRLLNAGAALMKVNYTVMEYSRALECYAIMTSIATSQVTNRTRGASDRVTERTDAFPAHPQQQHNTQTTSTVRDRTLLIAHGETTAFPPHHIICGTTSPLTSHPRRCR